MPDHLQRGRLLLDQRRYDDAEAFFRQAIAEQPDLPDAYAELTRCLMGQDGRRKEALEAIDQAIRHAPNVSHFHALRSLVLSRLSRGREALHAADEAIRLDPDESANHSVRSEAFLVLEKWADAEGAARHALTLDSDNFSARNLLALSLQYQGKKNEAAVALDTLLADDPESPYAHLNAGWGCLRRHDARQAEVHFREALRLDASLDAAREGLIESFKARSPLYRLYLRYCFFMQRIQAGARWALIIGLIVAVNLGQKVLETVHPLAATALVVLYLIFVLWVWLASGIGNFLILLDSVARVALKPRERREGFAVGGGLLAALGCAALASIWQSPALWVLAAGIGCAAMPAALYFTNDSASGRRVFGLLFWGLYLGSALLAAHEWWQGLPVMSHRAETFIYVALLSAMLCTWIGNIPSLRAERPS